MSYPMQTKPSVGFVEAGKLYFNNITNFSGRSRRSEYWMACLFLMVVSVVGGFLLCVVAAMLGEVGAFIVGAVTLVWSLVTTLASLSLCVRRLHDVGRSGWWYLLGLIPLGSIVLLVWCCTDSTEDNQWGPNPKWIRLDQGSFQNRGQQLQGQGGFGQGQRQIPEAIPATAPVSYCTLYLYAGPSAGKNIRLAVGKTVTVGRSGNCDVVLSEYSAVSGTHCQITVGSGFITITDLNSTNGTFVDGVRIQPRQAFTARNGAKVYLGNAICAIQVRFE